jgi:YVTN family beta-propeller protein
MTNWIPFRYKLPARLSALLKLSRRYQQKMKAALILLLVVFLVACGTKLTPPSGKLTPSTVGKNGTMSLIQTIPLPNVEGRIDHLSIDIKGQRLFVAALGNNTVEVLDLSTGKVTHSISDLSEPQSAVFIPSLNKIFVTNGGNGTFQIFDGSSFAELGRVDLSGDADNIRYDSNSASIVVGYGDGGLSFIDGESGKVGSNIKLDGHPESFQLESSGARVFVNIPSANEIAVVDREQKKVTSTWLMTSALSNFPMALDESQHRLFVGFRLPAKLIVFDTETGKSVASFESAGDVDDIFYDATHKMIFVIGGEGSIDIFSQQDADHYQLMTRIPTASGARTGLWVSELNRLYVAVPHRGTQEAGIQVYELQP